MAQTNDAEPEETAGSSDVVVFSGVSAVVAADTAGIAPAAPEVNAVEGMKTGQVEDLGVASGPPHEEEEMETSMPDGQCQDPPGEVEVTSKGEEQAVSLPTNQDLLPP